MSASALIKAEKLQVGNKMLLPFGRSATITEVSVGRRFVNMKTEHGNSRVEVGSEHYIEVQDPEVAQAEARVGDKATLHVWGGAGYAEVVGVIEAIDPCDGNGCDEYPHAEGEQCHDDYVILDNDKANAYFRHQITEVHHPEDDPHGSGLIKSYEHP